MLSGIVFLFPCPSHSYLLFMLFCFRLWAVRTERFVFWGRSSSWSYSRWGGVGCQELAGQRWAQSGETSIVMSCCRTRGCFSSISRLFLPWRWSGAARCLLALTVSPAHVMRGSSSMAGLLQMDVEPLWATGWLTWLPVDCTFTPFLDLILHKRSRTAVISEVS